jgi:hypothetical protein
MSSYLPRSDADRFWAAVTAATIAALVWLIVAVGPVAVGPEAAVAPPASRTALAAHIDEHKPAAGHAALDTSARTRVLKPAAREKIAES